MFFALLILVGIPMFLLRAHLGKVCVYYLITLFSSLLLFLGIALSAMLTLVFMGDAIRRWTIPDFFLNQMVRSDWFQDNFWAIFSWPIVLLVDLYRTIFYLNIFHGNIIMWGIMAWVIHTLVKIWTVVINNLHG